MYRSVSFNQTKQFIVTGNNKLQHLFSEVLYESILFDKKRVIILNAPHLLNCVFIDLTHFCMDPLTSPKHQSKCLTKKIVTLALFHLSSDSRTERPSQLQHMPEI
jgi:hypothetical protein